VQRKRPTGRARATAAEAAGRRYLEPAPIGVRTYVAFNRHLYAKFLGSAPTPGVQDFITDADAIQALQSGQIDLAWLSTPVALAAIAKGAPLVGIEGMNSPDWELDSTDPAIGSCSALKPHDRRRQHGRRARCM
jgi:hypothetical protein